MQITPISVLGYNGRRIMASGHRLPGGQFAVSLTGTNRLLRVRSHRAACKLLLRCGCSYVQSRVVAT